MIWAIPTPVSLTWSTWVLCNPIHWVFSKIKRVHFLGEKISWYFEIPKISKNLAETGGIYGMLVHSCVVNDGQGVSVPLINEVGWASGFFQNFSKELVSDVELIVIFWALRIILALCWKQCVNLTFSNTLIGSWENFWNFQNFWIFSRADQIYWEFLGSLSSQPERSPIKYNLSIVTTQETAPVGATLKRFFID